MDTDRQQLAGEPKLRASRLPRIKPTTLHRRLILLVIGATLPLLLLSVLVAITDARKARLIASERVLQTTRGAIATVDRQLENIFAGLEVLASSPALQSGDFISFDEEARRFLSTFPPDSGLTLANSAGRQLYNSFLPRATALPQRFDQEAVDAVFSNRNRYVSNIYISPTTKRATVTLDIPVMNNDDVIYVLSFSPPRSIFFEILDKLNLPQGWVVSIFDRKAQHVARNPVLASEGITTAAESLRGELSIGNDRILNTTSLEGVEILTAFSRSSSSGWTVAMGMPFEVLEEPARHSLFLSLTIGAVFMAVAVVFAGQLATQMVRGEAHRELLLNELNHRVKNMLSSVQSIVGHGLKKAAHPSDARVVIEARLLALSRAHEILSSRNWESAELTGLVRAIVEPYAESGRILLNGPTISLSPRVAISFAMIVNELATNAVKHGALSGSEGVVEVSWEMIEPDRLRMKWRESGGPIAHQPSELGFGTRLISRAVEHEFSGSYQAFYSPQGLTSIIEINL